MIVVPSGLRAFGRWQHEGAAGVRWIEDLPLLVDRLCARWDLVVDGEPMHGYHSVAVPVRRADDELVLKVTWPDEVLVEQALALRWWAGRSAVRLVDADPAAGALLVERLDHLHPLRDVPLADAVPVAGRLLRALAVPPPDGLRHTSVIAAGHRDGLAAQWARLGRPFDEGLLTAAIDAAGRLAGDTTNVLVNSDLHYDQVLRDRHGEWTVIDPAVVAGALEYQVAPLVWTRFDELGAERVRWCVDTLVDSAGLTPRLADDWALLRTAEYWLWGLDNGLTEDPVRCARICAALQVSD